MGLAVLILVVLEDAHEVLENFYISINLKMVLILVVLEDAHEVLRLIFKMQ